MLYALELAARAAPAEVSPNPRVGCVLVKGGKVVGEGYHKRFGGLHAEALALKQAGSAANNATAYITLEPCCHLDKKTPPCAQALAEAGVKMVVFGVRDSNPKVNGKGAGMLRKKGITVTEGILENQCLQLNRRVFKWLKAGKPHVTLKMACTIDGRITASTRWISNKQSLGYVQQLRSEHDAIIVGKNTVLKDNPRLTIRQGGESQGKNGEKFNLPFRASRFAPLRHHGDDNDDDDVDVDDAFFARQPLRVILDANLETPLTAKVFHNGPVAIACTAKAAKKKEKAFKNKGVEVIILPSKNGRVSPKALLAALGKRGIATVLVEGGGEVATSFLEAGLVDEAYFFVAPFLSGTAGVPLFGGKEKRFSQAEASVLGDNAVFHLLK